MLNFYSIFANYRVVNYHYFMNYEDFLLRDSTLSVPTEAFKPQLRCPYCQSVHLTDLLCESCGRSLIYHPIGDAFGFKSFTGIKERYVASLSQWDRWFPIYEDKLSSSAQKYARQLEKRFDDLLNALHFENLPKDIERRYFYIELIFLIDELLDYGMSRVELEEKIESNFIDSNQILSAELLKVLKESHHETFLVSQSKLNIFLNQKQFGIRRDFWFKFLLIMATLFYVAISFFEFVNLLNGK